MQAAYWKETYRLMQELLRGIQHESAQDLEKFGISSEIYVEIKDELARSGELISHLALPPYDLAFVADATGRIPFDIFDTGFGSESFRVACQLWSHEKKTDLTLIADLSLMLDEPHLAFILLETQ
jgi:hypothetical protein